MDDAQRDDLVHRLATAVEAIEERLDGLQEHLALLTTRVGLGATPMVARTTTESPVALTEWVTWLTDRYELTDAVPDCWSHHAPLVEELDALRVARLAAYDAVEGRPTDPLMWHEALQRSLTRIREWDRTKCRTRGHAA